MKNTQSVIHLQFTEESFSCEGLYYSLMCMWLPLPVMGVDHTQKGERTFLSDISLAAWYKANRKCQVILIQILIGIILYITEVCLSLKSINVSGELCLDHSYSTHTYCRQSPFFYMTCTGTAYMLSLLYFAVVVQRWQHVKLQPLLCNVFNMYKCTG